MNHDVDKLKTDFQRTHELIEVENQPPSTPQNRKQSADKTPSKLSPCFRAPERKGTSLFHKQVVTHRPTVDDVPVEVFDGPVGKVAGSGLRSLPTIILLT